MSESKAHDGIPAPYRPVSGNLRAERKGLFDHAKADFVHWSKATYWTLEEGTALLFGRDPGTVNWDSVRPYTKISDLAKEYGQVRDLALRAKHTGQLSDPVVPGFFLAWAKQTEIDIPAGLLEEVARRGIAMTDWKSNYEKLETKSDECVEAAQQLSQVLGERIAQLEQECAQLTARAADAESKLQSAWEGFDHEAENYPQELDIALQAWRSVSMNRDTSKTVKQQIVEWIDNNCQKLKPQLSDEAKQRIATACNWDKKGGGSRS